MKRHAKLMKEEQLYRTEKFEELNESRKDKRQITIEEDLRLKQLGYERFKKDTKDVEESIEKARQSELAHAKQSFLKLRASMEMTERKQKEAEENFNKSAVEAKKTLENIQREVKRKEESATRTINKIKEKCQSQFETQKLNYKNYEQFNDQRLLHYSEKVYNKFNMTNQKTKELKDRSLLAVEDHKQRNEERFYTRDEGLQRT